MRTAMTYSRMMYSEPNINGAMPSTWNFGKSILIKLLKTEKVVLAKRHDSAAFSKRSLGEHTGAELIYHFSASPNHYWAKATAPASHKKQQESTNRKITVLTHGSSLNDPTLQAPEASQTFKHTGR